MLPYPNINLGPIHIGPIKIRWYGIMYALSLLASYFLIKMQRRARELGLQGAMLQNLIFYLAVVVYLPRWMGFS